MMAPPAGTDPACAGARNPARTVRSIPSLIKWTGGKRSQVPALLRYLPSHGRYLEPFLGGGALLYAAAGPGSIAGDSYRPLIELWRLLRDSPALVVADYRAQWQELARELDRLDRDGLAAGTPLPAYFYRVRERFNRENNPLDLNFIMRTCVNGIVRFNGQGQFNNSFHLSRRGMRPDRFAGAVLQWGPAMRGVEFSCADYAETLARAVPGDFVYLDPPYAGNRQRYAASLDLEAFFANLDRLNARNVKWALSFDGRRGIEDLLHDVPKSLYRRHVLLPSGASAVNKVLNGSVQAVTESLYMNY